MTMQTRSQKYAQSAYERISAIKGAKYEGKYSDLCKKLSPMILTNGLMQTIMFLEAKSSRQEDDKKEDHKKKDNEYKKLLEHLAQTLDLTSLLDDVRQTEVSEYMMLTEKALEAANWYKRFAEALLEDETGKPAATSETQNEGQSHENKNS